MSEKLKSENIHRHPERSRYSSEALLGQRGVVLWFCGLSGSGKSTIAASLDEALHERGYFTIRLDGDNLRSGLNGNLGFSDEDRFENIRRTAELAKILSANSVIVLCSLITPKRAMRALAREILGDDFHEIYVKASYSTCESRDPKGLYAKAQKGAIANFTGRGSAFEEPHEPRIILDTERSEIMDSVSYLIEYLSQNNVTRKAG